MKPLIGINCDIRPGPPRFAEVQTNYTEAILKAGGIPVLLPPMPPASLEEVVHELSGIMLIGGSDYHPASYGEQIHDTVQAMDSEREEFDRRLVDKVLKQTKLPILGICAGCQLLNIILGGTLIQDIKSTLPESKVEHKNNPKPEVEGHRQHAVRIESGSMLAKFYSSSRVNVPTSHHQAVDRIGDGLAAVAFSDDDIIEAIELSGRPFTIAVQWHPERDFITNENLFGGFIRASLLPKDEHAYEKHFN